VAVTDYVSTPPELAGEAYISAVRSKAAELKTQLINQTLNDIASWDKAVRVQWTNAHPGQNVDTRGPLSQQEYGEYQDRVTRDYYEWLPPAFERYLKPDPDAADVMIDALAVIVDNFEGSVEDSGKFIPVNPGLSRITSALIDMDHWHGALQVNFVEKFLAPLEIVAHNEATVAKLSRELLLFNKIHYIRYRKAVLNLLDGSMQAVTQLNDTKDPKPVMWGTLAINSIGTALAAGSGMVLAVGTVLSVAATLASGLIPDPKEKSDLSAPTAQEVAVNIVNGMSKLDADSAEGEENLALGFRELYNTISAVRSSNVANNTPGPLNVARPTLDNASAADILAGSFTPDR
jgi:hypothetical protein